VEQAPGRLHGRHREQIDHARKSLKQDPPPSREEISDLFKVVAPPFTLRLSDAPEKSSKVQNLAMQILVEFAQKPIVAWVMAVDCRRELKDFLRFSRIIPPRSIALPIKADVERVIRQRKLRVRLDYGTEFLRRCCVA